MTQGQKIEIRGFRSLASVTWEPDKLNVIIGKNGSGKSNLLWALALLKGSASGALREPILAEGGIRQLLWDHSAPEIAWKVKLLLKGPAREQSVRPWTYELVLRPKGFEGGYFIAHELLADYQRVESGEKAEPFKLIEGNPSHEVIWDGEQRKLVPPNLDAAGEPDSRVASDETLLSRVSPFGDPWVLLFARALLRFRVHHDLATHRKAAVREAAVSRVETALAPDGRNLVPVLHTLYSGNRQFKKSVDSAMRAAFTDDFEELVFAPAADQKVQLRVRWRALSEPVSAADLSDGTLRFLMMVTALANPEPATLIAIDEPESGLHPQMFPIVAEFAAAASDRTTVVLTTHSPPFLDSFPSDCVPAVTVSECIDGETRLSLLPREELRRWLKEFSLGSMLGSGDLEALT